MIYQQLLEKSNDRRVRVGLIGTGSYGLLLLAQSLNIPRLEITVICDRNPDTAMIICKRAGLLPERIRICDGREMALKALETGNTPIVESADLLVDLPVDVIVECTGVAEAGARHADLAIKHGKHVVMVNKEADSAIGSILKYHADRAGLVYTPADGDQHGLLSCA